MEHQGYMNVFERTRKFAGKYTILLILIISALIRLAAINYSLPEHIALSDENTIMCPLMRMLRTGDLNPHNFTWPGSFVMYILAGIFILPLKLLYFCNRLCGNVDSWPGFWHIITHSPLFYYKNVPVLFILIGRIVNVAFAVITVYFVYLIGKLVLNRCAGLLAALCLSIAPLHVDYSRRIRPDIAAPMLIMISTYFLLRYAGKEQKIKFLILASLFAGFSVAARYAAGIALFPILLYGAYLDSRQKKIFSVSYLIDSIRIRTNFTRAAFFSFLGFLVFAPFVLLDIHSAIEALRFETGHMHLGHERLPGLKNHIWHVKFVLVKGIGGLGPGGKIFASFSALGFLIVLLKRSTERFLLILSPLFFFVFISGFAMMRWDRWLLPVIPFEAVLFGIGFYYAYDFLRRLRPRRVFETTALCCFTAILLFAYRDAMEINFVVMRKIMTPHMKEVATRWIEKNLPSGSMVASEFRIPVSKNKIIVKKMIKADDQSIATNPLDYYRKAGADHILMYPFYRQRMLNDPEKYKTEIERYDEIERETTLIKRFSPGKTARGPVTEIRKINDPVPGKEKQEQGQAK